MMLSQLVAAALGYLDSHKHLVMGQSYEVIWPGEYSRTARRLFWPTTDHCGNLFFLQQVFSRSTQLIKKELPLCALFGVLFERWTQLIAD